MSTWVKENERIIAFVQCYRIGNSIPNPVRVDGILLACDDVNLLHGKSRPCLQDPKECSWYNVSPYEKRVSPR